MTENEVHPENCQCEPCKTFRHNATMKESYPEEHRRQRIVKGRDSTPNEVERRIPEGMTERDARAAGYI